MGFLWVSMSPTRMSSLLLTAITISDGGFWFSETILFIRNEWLCFCRCRILLVSSSIYNEASLAPTRFGMCLMQTSVIRPRSRQFINRANGVSCSIIGILPSALLSIFLELLFFWCIVQEFCIFIQSTQYREEPMDSFIYHCIGHFSRDIWGKHTIKAEKWICSNTCLMNDTRPDMSGALEKKPELSV